VPKLEKNGQSRERIIMRTLSAHTHDWNALRHSTNRLGGVFAGVKEAQPVEAPEQEEQR